MNDFDLVGKPLIYLITAGKTTTENFTETKSEILKLIAIAVESKVSLIQIREKNLSARFVYELASEAAEITRRTNTKLLVNDRADIALAANADGVHLTSRSLSANIIKRNFPKDFIVGVSAHHAEEIETAERQGADFATFSPIFSSPGKDNLQGVEKLREVCGQMKPFPIIALGGVDENNWRQLLQAGASGFAAIRFLNSAKNLEKLKVDLYNLA